MAGRRRTRGLHAGDREASALLIVCLLAAVAGLLYVGQRAAGPLLAAPAGESTSVSASPDAQPTPPPPQSIVPGVVMQRIKKSCGPVTVSHEFTVVNYNIKSASWRGRRLDEIVNALRSWEPDVVLLQEVDRGRYRSRGIDLPTYIAEQLGMDYAFGENVPRGSGGYGTATLSRFPIVESTNHHLPWRPGPAAQQRGLLHTVIDVEGIEVSTYNTHLQNLQEGTRVLQISEIGRIMAPDPRPKLMGGDFNSWPTSRVMRIAYEFMDDTWTALGNGGGATHPATNPRGRIDILLHEDLTPVRADVPHVVLSDHLPVRATYAVESTSRVCVPVLD